MQESWKFFLFLVLACFVAQGFFAMLEMACVSFNKVRLQYYVSKNNRRALWLSHLLNNPAQLFGTTLIGVNASLQIGSECARRFYLSLDLSPDVAPLSQVILVIIFAELAPLFAGRRYAEHVAMLGIPIIYLFSIILKPVIWLFNLLCHLANRMAGSPGTGDIYLTREELQNILEEREHLENEEFDTIVSNIFTLKNKTAKELMIPLSKVKQLNYSATIGEMRNLLTSKFTPYIPLYHRNIKNITAIAYPRDLLRLSDGERVKEHARPPWFITADNSIIQILKQFQRNNQSVAIVLNEAGSAVGILTFDEVVDEILGQSDDWVAFSEMGHRSHHIVVDRKFPGNMKISDFNQQFGVHLESEGAETLEELMHTSLGHHPEEGESVRIDQFELVVEEASLLGVKMVTVRTVY